MYILKIYSMQFSCSTVSKEENWKFGVTPVANFGPVDYYEISNRKCNKLTRDNEKEMHKNPCRVITNIVSKRFVMKCL